MFKWFKKLFAPSCEHTFSQWQITKRMSNSSGSVTMIQERVCSKCGFTELDKQHV